MWDATRYLAFSDHRGRPFFELLARVGATEPRAVVDLGCGPGNLTVSLSERWPSARLLALDSDADMVAAARQRGVPAAHRYVGGWSPPPDADVVVANAVLQWIPGHRRLLRSWVSALPAGAWLAFQVPGNFGEPSHRVIRELAATGRWVERLDGVTLRGEDAVDSPEEYARLLTGSGCMVDAWETTYLQRLTGDDPVLDWVSGTALRPVRAALDDASWQRFGAELAPRLREAYPRDADGVTWFPFRRVFAVARTAG